MIVVASVSSEMGKWLKVRGSLDDNILLQFFKEIQAIIIKS